MNKRTSRRTYRDEKIEKETVEQLNDFVNECNKESGLHIRLIENGADAFSSFSSSYGMFRGVKSYFAMAGDKNLPHFKELIGYYGQAIVLECVSKYLGTCWVSGSFSKENAGKQAGLSDGEELACVIPFGYVSEEKTFREKAVSLIGGHKKPFDEFIRAADDTPDWVTAGVDAAMKAPSAMNKQPVRFSYRDGQVRGMVKDPASYQGIDLGIARLHFELGAVHSGFQGKWVPLDDEFVFQAQP